MRDQRAHRRLAAPVLGLALLAGMAACADPEDQALCPAYERFLDAATTLESVSLDGSTAGEAADRVEVVLGEVRHLDSVADTRYGDQLDQLETALDDLLRTLESVQEDADAATWQPLVEDSVEDARHSSLVVTELIDPVCRPETS